jgi:adenylyl-sulfate kinase
LGLDGNGSTCPSAGAQRKGSSPVVWLTGLPCAGKSTIAALVAAELRAAGRRVRVLDGDELRHAISADLGFSAADRREQARRAALLAAESLRRGEIPIVALVSPQRAARAEARAILGDAFIEIHVDAPAAVCETRDVKGMYARARRGEIDWFTGVSAPYERPEAPALRLCTAEQSAAASARGVIALLARHGAV